MASVKHEMELLVGSTSPISVRTWMALAFNSSKSLKRTIWEQHLRQVKNLFDEGSEEEEDAALKIILKSESYAEIAFMVNDLSWTVLDDALDEMDNTQIAQRISALRDRDEHAVDAVLRRLALNPETFGQSQSAALEQAIHDRVTSLGGHGRAAFAEDLIARRTQLLDSIALFALRDQPTHARELRTVLDDLSGHLPAQAADLRALRWDIFYENRVCVQLEQARYRLLITTLPDMVDPNLSLEQRRALFDTLNRRDAEFRAMQSYINVLGTVKQRTDVEWFMDARALFLDTFTPNPPTPATIQSIAAFFDSVASEIVGLRTDVVNSAQNLIDSLTLGHLMESEKDDKAREAVGKLGQRRAVLPFQWKALLIRMMEEGTMDDDDEQAVLELLIDSKGRSIAEFAQLIAAQNWETLSFSFDGQEYDDLEKLLSKW